MSRRFERCRTVGEIRESGGRCDGGRGIGRRATRIRSPVSGRSGESRPTARSSRGRRVLELGEQRIQDLEARPSVSGSVSAVSEESNGNERPATEGRFSAIASSRSASVRMPSRSARRCARGRPLSAEEASKEERTSGQGEAGYSPHARCEVSIGRAKPSARSSVTARPGPDARARPSPRTGDRRRCT